MTNSENSLNESTLKRLSDESWELRLSVDSEFIESLAWVWTAEVSVEDGPNEGTIAISPAAHSPVGMPEGDTTGSYSYSSKLTVGTSGTPAGEFKPLLAEWEQECRQISSVLDSSVMRRREDVQRRKKEEERKAENRENVVTYLESLVAEGEG